MQALTNATKCNIHDCQRRSDNLLRNGVIPLNRDATTSKSYAALCAIELWTVIMRDLWIRRNRYLSLWLPATLLNILPGAGVSVQPISLSIIHLPIPEDDFKLRPITQREHKEPAQSGADEKKAGRTIGRASHARDERSSIFPLGPKWNVVSQARG